MRIREFSEAAGAVNLSRMLGEMEPEKIRFRFDFAGGEIMVWGRDGASSSFQPDGTYGF